MSNLNDQKIKCERCQKDQANIICQACQPFHYFCSRCDSIVHSMRIRLSHTRQNLNCDLSNNSLNSKSISTNNCSYLTTKNEYNNKSNQKKLKYYRVSTPTKTVLRGSSPPNVFGEEFLNEINRILNKEKESLQYKIDTLENNNERLKLNFQNEIRLKDERINNILKDKKNMEEKYNEILALTVKQHREKIGEILNENNNLKEKNRILIDELNTKEEMFNKNIVKCNNKIEQLKNELKNERKNSTSMNKTHINKITELVKNNNNDIKNLNELHKKELNEVYYDGKFKNEKLMQEIENSSNKIEYLIYENKKLRESQQKLENYNKEIISANNNLKNKLDEFSKNMDIIRELNSSIQKNNEKLKIENSNLKNDKEKNNNIIIELKKEVNLINDIYTNKEKEFNNLFEQYEKMRKNFTQNMFNNEDLESDNRQLRKENDELKKIIYSFNNDNPICFHPFSNY